MTIKYRITVNLLKVSTALVHISIPECNLLSSKYSAVTPGLSAN